ncbi:MAG TPA: hypothetical protein VIH57_13770 [Bacteroidales bacterium]
MKRITSLLVVSVATCLLVSAQGKLKENLAALKSKIGEVKIDKTVFSQSLEILNEETGKLVYTSVETDEKGKSSKDAFEFFLADIDKNTVIRKTSGKKMMVSLSTNNNLRFIKHLKDEKMDSYAGSFEILVGGSDEATSIIDIIKSTIPLVKASDMNWNTPAEALNWMKENLGKVTLTSGSVDQTFSYDPNKVYLVNYDTKTTDAKGVTVEEKYDFNLLDINRNDIKVKVNGANLVVTAPVKGGDKFIKYTKNGALQSYASDVDIPAADIEQARNIISALSVSISKSKALFPEFQNVKQALDYFKTNTAKVDVDSKSVGQKIDFTDDKGIKTSFVSSETDSKGKNVDYLYEFYLADVEVNTIACKVSGKKISILFNCKNKQKFIRYSKDNVVQNYQYDFDMMSDNLETARCMIEALKYALKNSKDAPVSFTSMASAFDFLKNNVIDLKTATDQYKQVFTGNTAEPFPCKYELSRTDAKGVTTDESSEFYPYLLDPNTVTIKSAGKYLTVNALVKDKKSFIKRFKKGEQQSYDNELELMTSDVKQAKDITEAIKYIAANGKPKDKSYNDKQTAVNFIISQVGNFKGAGKEVKQKLEMVNNEPCKLNLTINTTDDKGKTTDEIYEFNLSDMNKLMVDFKISGKNVFIVLATKNKNKLVKVYKNSAQQAYDSDIEIMEDDVDTARNIADAFKAAIVMCEQ